MTDGKDEYITRTSFLFSVGLAMVFGLGLFCIYHGWGVYIFMKGCTEIRRALVHRYTYIFV